MFKLFQDWPVAKSGRECPRVPRGLQESPRVSTSLQECPRVAKSGQEWPRVAESVQEYPSVSKSGYSPKVGKSRQECPRAAKSLQEWPRVSKSGQQWPRLAKTGQVWPRVAKSGGQGVFSFVYYSPAVMLAHCLAVVDSFFAALPDMVFSPKEATRLGNTQLIPKLAFRMAAHRLSPDKIITIQNRIWSHYTGVTKLAGNIPPKARFAPCQEGALGLFHLPSQLPDDHKSKKAPSLNNRWT